MNGYDMLTQGYKNLRFEFNTSFDGEDPWGSTIEWLFAVMETLYHAGGDMPAHWEFHDSPMHVDGPEDGKLTVPAYESSHSEGFPVAWWEDAMADSMIAMMFDHGDITCDDLIAWGNVLNKYAGLLKSYGKDY